MYFFMSFVLNYILKTMINTEGLTLLGCPAYTDKE
jgi:hypothetical protein